jgi:isocitrate lyase
MKEKLEEQLKLNTTKLIEFMEQPRFEDIKRPYTPEQVAMLLNTVSIDYFASQQATKLFGRLKKCFEIENLHKHVRSIGSCPGHQPIQVSSRRLRFWLAMLIDRHGNQ